MLLEYNMRIVQNRVGSWQRQQYQYFRHTISSRVTKSDREFHRYQPMTF